MEAVLKLADFGSARKLPRGNDTKVTEKSSCFLDSTTNRIEYLEREFDMTALVCTAWYRAPELLNNIVTAGRVDRVDDRDQLTMYGAAVDVWSYGAVMYEMLAGEQLAASRTGAGLLHGLLEKVETCPFPCFDAGQEADVPDYMSEHGWELVVRGYAEYVHPLRTLASGQGLGCCWCLLEVASAGEVGNAATPFHGLVP